MSPIIRIVNGTSHEARLYRDWSTVQMDSTITEPSKVKWCPGLWHDFSWKMFDKKCSNWGSRPCLCIVDWYVECDQAMINYCMFCCVNIKGCTIKNFFYMNFCFCNIMTQLDRIRNRETQWPLNLSFSPLFSLLLWAPLSTRHTVHSDFNPGLK